MGFRNLQEKLEKNMNPCNSIHCLKLFCKSRNVIHTACNEGSAQWPKGYGNYDLSDEWEGRKKKEIMHAY